MSEYRYKAFISYSHQDEQWGRWLQRALESYRVPRRLVGAEGRFGPVPARIAPVFRDREDLSSAADLTASVKEELAASETLIVICSPAAAASRWVNEEVRRFRALGRGDRILALIVDGDPLSQDPENQCFPPAVVESADGVPFEPLAADARKWADGKALARLKLVAGILGIRLDDLRRRDMQRRHRLWMFSASGAMTVAVITSVLAVMAITARNQAENRREHAENLVGYMVGDLREKLDEVGRLDILEGLGGEVSDYLATLDPSEVTDDSLEQQAMVWRQLGEVSMNQGKLDEAMSAFRGSRDVLAELQRREPLNQERIYQLGNAEFWVGFVHLEKGEFEAARGAFDRYLAHADRLVALDAENPEWLLEKAYGHGNIATLLINQKSDNVEQALGEIRTSVELNRMVVEIEPDNEDYLSDLSEGLAWQASTELLLCDLGGAFKSRQENVAIARQLTENNPRNSHLQKRLAYALSGLADVAQQIGLEELAMENFEQASRILGQLLMFDPANTNLRWEQERREFFLGYLQAESEDINGALNRLGGIYESMHGIIETEEEQNLRHRQGWISYLLVYADAAWRSGNTALASELRARAVGQLANWLAGGENLDSWRNDLVRTRFLLWQHSDQTLLDQMQEGALAEVRLDPGQQQMGCADRGTLIQQALLEGNIDEAHAQTEYLLGKGYFEPGFIRICRQYDLCQGPG